MQGRQGAVPGCGALTCGQGVRGAVAEAFLTAAKAAMAGQLQGSLRAVPAVPGKLVFAFFNTALGTSCHAAGVDQVSLQGSRSQSSDSQQLNMEDICPEVLKSFSSCPSPIPPK